MTVVTLAATQAASDRTFSDYHAYLDSPGLIFFQPSQSQPVPLQAPRQDVGQPPTEITFGSGFRFAMGDFSHGQGQDFYHRDDRDEAKFLHQEGYDLSTPDTLGHLRQTLLNALGARLGQNDPGGRHPLSL